MLNLVSRVLGVVARHGFFEPVGLVCHIFVREEHVLFASVEEHDGPDLLSGAALVQWCRRVLRNPDGLVSEGLGNADLDAV